MMTEGQPLSRSTSSTTATTEPSARSRSIAAGTSARSALDCDEHGDWSAYLGRPAPARATSWAGSQTAGTASLGPLPAPSLHPAHLGRRPADAAGRVTVPGLCGADRCGHALRVAYPRDAAATFSRGVWMTSDGEPFPATASAGAWAPRPLRQAALLRLSTEESIIGCITPVDVVPASGRPTVGRWPDCLGGWIGVSCRGARSARVGHTLRPSRAHPAGAAAASCHRVSTPGPHT